MEVLAPGNGASGDLPGAGGTTAGPAVRLVGGLVFGEAALLLLTMQFEVAPSGYHAGFNVRVAAGLLVIGTLYGLAVLHRRLGAHVKMLEPQIGVFFIGANLLSLSMLTSEINAHWPLGSSSEMATMSALAMHVVAWTWVGTSLVWLGGVRREVCRVLDRLGRPIEVLAHERILGEHLGLGLGRLVRTERLDGRVDGDGRFGDASVGIAAVG